MLVCKSGPTITLGWYQIVGNGFILGFSATASLEINVFFMYERQVMAKQQYGHSSKAACICLLMSSDCTNWTFDYLCFRSNASHGVFSSVIKMSLILWWQLGSNHKPVHIFTDIYHTTHISIFYAGINPLCAFFPPTMVPFQISQRLFTTKYIFLSFVLICINFHFFSKWIFHMAAIKATLYFNEQSILLYSNLFNAFSASP